MCVDISPESFSKNGCRTVYPKFFCVPISLEDECRLAVELCPRSAIKTIVLKQFEG
jgi:ferredoxin